MTATRSPRKKAPAKKATAKKKTTTVTDAHKQAMAEGRQQSAAIRRYLDAHKAANAPKARGRRRTPESINERLDKIGALLASDPEPMSEVKLIQERIDLRAELDSMNGDRPDPTEFEADFIKAVGPYSQRQGLTYQAWRELGVPAIVLRKAQVPR